MARNARKTWDSLLADAGSLPSPLAGSPLDPADDIDVGAQQGDASPAVSADDGPDIESVGDQQTNNDQVSTVDSPPPPDRPASPAPVLPPRLQRPAPAAQARRPPVLRPGDLEAAQEADRAEQRKAAFENGLDMAAFRRPVAERQVGSPNASALMQRLGLERQGRQDERQARQDEQSAFLNDARVKAYLAKTDPKAAKPLSELQEAQLRSYNDRHSKAGRDAEDLEKARKAIGEEMGIDASNLSMAAIEAIRKVREGKANRAHRTKAEEIAERAQAIREAKLGIAKTHQAREISQSSAAGYEPDPERGGRVMQASEAKDLGAEVAARDKIDQKVNEMQAMIKAHHGVPLIGNDEGIFNNLYAEVKPLLTTSTGMGNFTQGHEHVVTEAMSNPREWQNLINSGRFSAILEKLREGAHQAVEASARAKGQRAVGHGAKPVPRGLDLDAPEAPAGGKVRILDPQGRPHRIDPAEVAEAEKHGWKQVQ